jgi:hypothetical protein
MKSYVIYDTTTGYVIKTITGTERTIELNTKKGQAYIEGRVSEPNKMVVDGEIVDRPKSEDELRREAIGQVLTRRSVALVSSDWTQIGDVPLNNKEAWATYRQALRDIPKQEGYPFNVVWPTEPS